MSTKTMSRVKRVIELKRGIRLGMQHLEVLRQEADEAQDPHDKAHKEAQYITFLSKLNSYQLSLDALVARNQTDRLLNRNTFFTANFSSKADEDLTSEAQLQINPDKWH